MPWDHSNVRSWELYKTAPRMSLSAYRSGLYKRAVVVLQDQSHDGADRASAAHSLQKALSHAHANYTAEYQPALPEQADTNSAGQQQQPSSDRKSQLQKDHHAKLLMQHLRRQRQQQRHEQNKLLWQQRHEQKVKLRQEQLELQVKQHRQEQDEALQQLEHLKQNLCQNKQDAAAIMEATQSEKRNLVAAPLQNLNKVQEKKATAEAQFAKASLAGEHMSRRAASIEPEDGECTPSPNAVLEAQDAVRHHAIAHPPAMQALPPPPPPPTINVRPDHTYQVKDGKGRNASGVSTSGRVEYSAHHYSDTSLPPPPPLH